MRTLNIACHLLTEQDPRHRLYGKPEVADCTLCSGLLQDVFTAWAEQSPHPVFGNFNIAKTGTES